MCACCALVHAAHESVTHGLGHMRRGWHACLVFEKRNSTPSWKALTCSDRGCSALLWPHLLMKWRSTKHTLTTLLTYCHSVKMSKPEVRQTTPSAGVKLLFKEHHKSVLFSPVTTPISDVTVYLTHPAARWHIKLEVSTDKIFSCC